MTSIFKKSVCKKIRVTPLTSVTYWCGIYKLSISYGLMFGGKRLQMSASDLAYEEEESFFIASFMLIRIVLK